MTEVDECSEMPLDFVQTEGSFDEYSNQHWQNKTASLTDEFIKLKFQLETSHRDRDRDAATISSLKHVRRRVFCMPLRSTLTCSL